MQQGSNSSSRLWTKDFILLSGSNFGMFLTCYFLIPTLPVFSMTVLGLSQTAVGLALAIYTISALIIRPFVGLALDRFGRRLLLLSSFFLFVMFYPLYLAASGFVSLLLIRFLHGLAWGAVTTSGSTSAIDIIPAQRRGEGIGYYGLFITVAMSIGPLLGLWIAGEDHFDRLFYSSLLIGFVSFLLLLWVRFPAIPKWEPRSFSIFHLFEKQAFPISLHLMFHSLAYGGLLSFLSVYAIQSGLGHSGLFFLVMASGIGLMRVLAGRVFDRKGPDQVMIFGILALVLGFPLLAIGTHLFLFLAAGFLIGLGSGVVLPTSQAMVNQLVKPHRRGAVNSTLFTAFDLGIGAGMIITGWISQNQGLNYAFGFFALTSLLALLYYLIWVRKDFQRKLIESQLAIIP
jgi:predicted MFS family arabinose efflux permease